MTGPLDLTLFGGPLRPTTIKLHFSASKEITRRPLSAARLSPHLPRSHQQRAEAGQLVGRLTSLRCQINFSRVVMHNEHGLCGNQAVLISREYVPQSVFDF